MKFSPVNHDRFRLPDPVCPVLSLQVLLWVPVGVVDDDCVSGSQVDAQTSGPGRQDEYFDVGVVVKAVNVVLTLTPLHLPIKSRELEAPEVEVVTQDGQHQLPELGEYQGLVASCLATPKLVENLTRDSAGMITNASFSFYVQVTTYIATTGIAD